MIEILLTALCLAGACPKPVYNQLAFDGPNGETQFVWRDRLNERWGTQPGVILYHADLFEPDGEGDWDNSGWVSEDRLVRRLAKVSPCSIVIVNLEPGKYGLDYWHVLDPQGMGVNVKGLENRAKLMAWFKREWGHCRFGYYAQVPLGHAPGTMGSPARIESVRKTFKESKLFTDAVDFLVPQIYVAPDWPLEYTKLYIARQIIICRDYCPGKPIYPILWFEYYPSPERSVIPAAYWRTMLETAYALADGVILWGGYQQKWDGEAPWWEETKLFLRERGKLDAN